jgi:uncharacterized protein involved in exopolysaccharide biosynthesis
VEQIQDSLSAKPVKSSYLIEIKAKADDPQLAAAIANAAARELIGLSQDRFQTDAGRYRDFLKVEVDKAQTAADDANQAVQQYKQDNNLTDIQEELKVSAENSQNLRQQLIDTDVNLAAAEAQYRSLVAQRDRVSATLSTSSTVTTGRSSTTVTNTDANEVYQTLAGQAAQQAAKVAALQAQHDRLSDLLAPKPASSLPRQEATLRQLLLNLTAAEAHYNRIKQEYENQLVLAGEGSIEISRVDSAQPPLYPDRPLRYLFVLVGLMLGAAGGAGLGRYRDRAVTARVPSAFRSDHVLQPAFSVGGGASDQAAGFSAPDEPPTATRGVARFLD